VTAPGRARRGLAAVQLAFVASVTLLAGCGLPTDDTYKPISQDDLPFGLADTTTTSTTSTTVPPATTTTSIPSPTTTVPTEQVKLYFVAGNALRSVAVSDTPPVSPRRSLELLHSGPPPDLGLRTSIPAGAIVAVSVAGGRATVDLAAPALEPLGQEQLFEFGQIVLTLTDRPGIGQVEFRSPGPDGTPTLIAVPKGTGELVPIVSRDDYVNLLTSA
jgi:spore germination protein GerM